MDVIEWQRRLESAFAEGGIVGPHLVRVIDLERKCGEHFVSTFHGQSVLMGSFQSFYVESLRAAERWVAEHGWPEGEYYGSVLLTYLTVFRSFRACENLLLSGYPLDGYALLRDVKDRAVFVCGIARNLTTWKAIHSLDKKMRMTTEREMLKRILREGSGLPEETLKLLSFWEDLFNKEMHGSMLTFVTEMTRLLNGGGQMSVGPTPANQPMAMYMNRAVEVGWLFTRLLPYLQPEPRAFGAEWSRRQQILDESFRYSEQALADMGKPVAEAFMLLVDRNFTFGEDFCYFEADGIGPNNS